MFDLLEGLNPEQRAVAAFDEPGPLRVLAGAGTGKTMALAARVAWLIGSGVPAERLLLLTFTRRAAREMLTRTDSLLSRSAGARGRASGRVQGGTFHSVAHRTLRRHGDRLGLPDGFTVLDTADAADVMDLIRDEHARTTAERRRFPRKALLLDLYSRAVNTGRALPAVTEEIAPWCQDLVGPIGTICKEYVSRKRSLGLLDFDDLLLYWRAAALDPAVGRRLGADIDHVLVDEYQDVNALQVDIVAALRATDRRLTVVGDDAQAVYGFRAADPRHLLDFDVAFPGTTTITLQTNYRSSPEILAVANAVGRDAPEGFRAVLRAADPERSGGAAPRLLRCADEDVQSSAVCEQVLAHREEGLRLQDQAVLVRAAHHSDRLEIELSRRRIPYLKYGGLRYLEAAHVKDLLAAFRLADNPRDALAWFRLLQLLDGVGPATARRAVAALGLDEEDPAGEDADVLLRWPLAAALLPARNRAAADTVAAALRRHPGEPVGVHAARLREAVKPLVESNYPDGVARLNDLDALVGAAATAARLTDVAADYTLEPPRSTGDLAGDPLIDEDWLVISTVHSAKGLEWDVVHLLHVADGNFPSDLALESAQGLEEERRLFYVALTRPRRALHVYLPLRYHHHPRARDDRHSWAQPSRFLSAGVREHLTESTRGHPEAAAGTELVERLDANLRVAAQLESLWG
jgi:DNA helicase-2/ATP-dependent DNA helicase PcrA